MQAELNAESTLRPIRILGVNEIGHESGNSAMISGRVLPWLQATTDANVWQLWDVTFRDVVVLDAQNKRTSTYNLTSQDLSNPEKYAELKQILRDAANSAN